MALALGIVTPVLHMNPRFDPPEWEVTAGVDDVVWVVQEAELAGLRLGGLLRAHRHSVGCVHRARRPLLRPLLDAGLLRRQDVAVGLLTHMAVLPYHHPLELVKRLGTLDVLSGGRVIAGVGVGSLKPEFEVLGPRLRRAGRSVRRRHPRHPGRLGQRVPEYHGTHYDFEGFIVEPSGLVPGDRGLGRRPHPPLTAPRPRAG